MPTGELPWLYYSGQTTLEIIACKNTHRIDSLLCAFEEGIQLRQARHGKRGTTPEERILLGIMALQREVNNGGYHQFFVNSSRQYAPGIVRALQRAGCHATAALTEKAIGALDLGKITVAAVAGAIYTRDARRDKYLNARDQEFYQLNEIESKLFHFVESHQDRYVLERTSVPPRPSKRGFTNVTRLCTRLEFSPKTDHSFDAVRRLASDLASQGSIAATGAEIDGATYLFLFERFLRAGDLAACERIAPHVFELAREDTTHCVLHKAWAEKLIEASNQSLADAATLQYLEYLNGDDKSSDFIKKRVSFWAGLIRRHAIALPRSVEFFRVSFPDVGLDLTAKSG